MKKFNPGIFLLMILLAALLLSFRQAAKEYEIKATFLYNFTQFVTWPESTLEEGSPFVIGIVGEDPFGKYLDEIIKDERVQGHAIIIKRFAAADAVEPVHILFVNLTDKAAIKKVLDKVKDKHTLTVSDALNVEKQRGIIRFVTDNNKTKLRINLAAAKDADVTISSKLLNLAEIVNSP